MKVERDAQGKTRVAKGDKSGLGGRFAPDINFFRNKVKANRKIIEDIPDSEVYVDEFTLTLQDNLQALKDFQANDDGTGAATEIANEFYSNYISCDDMARAVVVNQMSPEDIETVCRSIHPQYANAFLTSTVLTDDQYQSVSNGYLSAAFFTDLSDDEASQDKTSNDLSWQAEVAMDEDIKEFIASNLELVAEATHRSYGLEDIGKDYWLSRSGSGVGFSDRTELAEGGLGKKLDEAVRSNKKYEWSLIVGDDGKLYFE